jgi:DNA-binding NarL/FixJ family response regulator
MTPPTTTIFIADDHPIFRQGLRQLLEQEPGFSVVGDAGDGPSALAAIARLRPQVAILDVDMPGMDGLAIAAAVRERRLLTAIVCLTMHKDARILNSALNAGVMGYVIKDDAAIEIVESVRSAVSGRHFVSPQLTSLLVARHARAGAAAERAPGIEALTETERKVLRLLAEFKTTKEIASALAISPRTVDRHRSNMAEKLGLNGTHALTKFAVTHSSSL